MQAAQDGQRPVGKAVDLAQSDAPAVERAENGPAAFGSQIEC